MAWRGTSIVILCFLTVGIFGIHDADILELYKHFYTGDGTYYGNTPSGMCSYNIPSLPPVAHNVDKLVALNSEQMFTSSGCGLCFNVTGSGIGSGNNPITGTFIAYVKDVCPECHAGALDLAEDGDGRWSITIEAVQCPVGDTFIEYRFEGSNDYYIKMQVRNERMPATTVEMFQPKSQIWLTMKRTGDGFWMFPDGDRAEKPIQLPFKVRLHAPNGAMLEDTVKASSMGTQDIIHGTGVQFPLDPSLPSA